VLKALLPESGTDIKGQLKSRKDLLEASGYIHRPRDFDDVTRILDAELRLITPTDPEGSSSEGQQTTFCGQYYVLAHDYLVHSLRDWLGRKQRETKRGRAELRLAERSAAWNAKPENRLLPSALEWANIRLLTRTKHWSEPQRKMMKRAGRVYGLRSVLTLALLAVGILAGIAVRRQVIENQQATQAAGLVQRLLDADTPQVPEVIGAMREYRRWVDPVLRSELAKGSAGPRRKLHASLALLPVDASQVDYLFDRLLTATPSEVPVLRDALKPHRATLSARLWTVLESAKPGDASLLPAASALALYDSDGTKWEAESGKVAQALVSVNSLSLRPWIEALRPVLSKLSAPLAAIYQDKSRSETVHSLATDILTDYASDDPNLTADLLMDADPKAYAAFFPIAQRHEAKTLPLFQAEIDKRATIPESDKNSEIIKDRLAERQARAAVALVRMGKGDEIRQLLRHSADPRLRSFIVNWLSPLGGDPKRIVAELDRIDPNAKRTPAQGQQKMDSVLFHPETSMRRALILALGIYGTEGLSTGEREPLTGKLLDLYRSDPDSGIHGAAEWTLRKWGQQEKLKQQDAELSKLKFFGDRRWFVNSQGQTFAVIEGPVEFLMGSPPTDQDRDVDEMPLHRRIIPRRFAISAKEVSVQQFQAFLDETPAIRPFYNTKFSPHLDGPRISVSWYEAAAYCNWLSRRERLPECYERNQSDQYAAGMKIKPDALRLGGYRLPTEAEWEYASRAGAETSRHYGASVDLLGRYAWYSVTSQNHAHPCGSLEPNDLGLFDMLGNTTEWCQNVFSKYPLHTNEYEINTRNIDNIVDETNPRLYRGGNFDDYQPANLRSACRDWGLPSGRYINVGFRPCRTY
jgi:formylglycine-generating enzyme required for sulfatase activity